MLEVQTSLPRKEQGMSSIFLFLHNVTLPSLAKRKSSLMTVKNSFIKSQIKTGNFSISHWNGSVIFHHCQPTSFHLQLRVMFTDNAW